MGKLNKILRGFSPSTLRARTSALSFNPQWTNEPAQLNERINPLEEFFLGRQAPQRPIHKWTHYFEIYHRHLSKFRSDDICVLEIGLDHGGSIEMWRDYFGPGTKFHGVDIQASHQSYAADGVTIHIGDQADRNFWKSFRSRVPMLDVVLDDGGHEPHQQIVSLEELLPHLRPGGVYICEDIHGGANNFTVYASELVQRLNDCQMSFPQGQDVTIKSPTNKMQGSLHSVHFYPFVAVFERTNSLLTELISKRLPTINTDPRPEHS